MDDALVLKVGAVVLRGGALSAPSQPHSVHHASKGMDVLNADSPYHTSKGMDVLNAAAHDILIVRPIPKHAGEVPMLVLPRGTRQYQAADGQWHDARDAATGAQHADALEPFVRALAREIDEEAGVSAEALARAQVRALGVREFQSRSKGRYPIYWFVVTLADDDAAVLTDMVPVDASETMWATLSEIEAMAARGEFSAGYVPVVAEALGMLIV